MHTSIQQVFQCGSMGMSILTARSMEKESESTRFTPETQELNSDVKAKLHFDKVWHLKCQDNTPKVNNHSINNHYSAVLVTQI